MNSSSQQKTTLAIKGIPPKDIDVAKKVFTISIEHFVSKAVSETIQVIPEADGNFKLKCRY